MSRGRIVAKRRRQTIMAQQAGSAAQREPSMEEILASIRRIIEDNEPPKPEPDYAETAIGPAANDPAPFEVFGKAPEPEVKIEAPIVEPELEAILDQGVVIEEPALDMSAFSEAIEEETRRAADPQWDIAALRSLDERFVAHASKPGCRTSAGASPRVGATSRWSPSRRSSPSTPAARSRHPSVNCRRPLPPAVAAASMKSRRK